MEHAENKQKPVKRTRRRKSIEGLLPQVRDMVPKLYIATDYNSRRVAEDLLVNRLDVIDEYNRWRERKGPETATSMRPFLVQRVRTA